MSHRLKLNPFKEHPLDWTAQQRELYAYVENVIEDEEKEQRHYAQLAHDLAQRNMDSQLDG